MSALSQPILIDTNVISELFKPNPDPAVLVWFEKQDPQALYLTTLTIAELRVGAELLPPGKKRATLGHWIDNDILSNFKDRLLSFDLNAAQRWAKLTAADKKKGRPRPTVDAMIAAIALAQDATLATRNTKDFAGLGLRVVDPFEGR